MRYQQYGSDQHQSRAKSLEEESIKSFRLWCASRNIKLSKASKVQDMHQHIDYTIMVGDRPYTVDIKGAKRYSDLGFYLIEILNVIGNRGWLLGKADLIAFHQSDDTWLLVRRDNLYKMVRDLMGLQVMVKNGISVVVTKGSQSTVQPCAAPNYYRRSDRPREMVTYIHRSELETISENVLVQS